VLSESVVPFLVGVEAKPEALGPNELFVSFGGETTDDFYKVDGFEIYPVSGSMNAWAQKGLTDEPAVYTATGVAYNSGRKAYGFPMDFELPTSEQLIGVPKMFVLRAFADRPDGTRAYSAVSWNPWGILGKPARQQYMAISDDLEFPIPPKPEPIVCDGSAVQPCTIDHAIAEQTRVCDTTSGTWGDWGACLVVSCIAGYIPNGSNTACILAPVCSNGQTESQSCPIANGNGHRTRTCNAGAWNPWGACLVVSCITGYIPNGSNTVCVLVPPTPQQICISGGGYWYSSGCWITSAAGQNCSAACTAFHSSFSCQSGNWNVDSTVCSALGYMMGAGSVEQLYAPYIDTTTNTCRPRQTSTPGYENQDCALAAGGGPFVFPRICKCQ
jgi:uncharacterized protein YbaA (DUF1428 family)